MALALPGFEEFIRRIRGVGRIAVISGAVIAAGVAIVTHIDFNGGAGPVGFQLVFTTQPSGAVSGAPFTTQPVVTIEDSAGNTVTSGPDSTVTVTMTLASGTGSLVGTTTAAAVAGVATFAGLEIDSTGAHTLQASAPLKNFQSGKTATSSSFNVSSSGGITNGNLWIVTSGGTSSCVRSSTPVSLAAAPSNAKCTTAQAAQNAALAGDTVMIQAGTYASTFSITSGTRSSTVLYQAQGYTAPLSAIGVMSSTPTVVFTGGISLGNIDHVHIVGVSATAAPNTAGSGTVNQNAGVIDICSTRSACVAPQHTDVAIVGFHGKSAFWNGSGVTIDLSEFGGFDACVGYPSNFTEDVLRLSAGAPNATDHILSATVEQSVVHDEIMGTANGSMSNGCGAGSPSAGPHTDCFQSSGGDNITIDSNIFYNCPEQNMQWNPFSGQIIGNMLIQNNYFGPSAGSQIAGTATFGSVGDPAGPCAQVDFEYNLMYATDNAGGCTSGPIEHGNIFLGSGCSTGSFSFNSWTGTTCGSSAQHCTPTFAFSFPGYQLGQAVPNPKLASGDTCAHSHGDPAGFPGVDMLGVPRPLAVIDIGPTEIS